MCKLEVTHFKYIHTYDAIPVHDESQNKSDK